MSLEKTKSERVRTDEIIFSSSLSTQEVKKPDPILTSKTGKALDASTSIDAYMAAVAAQLETMIESSEQTNASYAAEESAKSSDSDEETLVIVSEDEEPSGPFSKQKGGSAALSIDAYINAMNAQLESIKLRRERSSLMIHQELKMTEYAANNVIEIGKKERSAHMLMGAAHLTGAAVSGYGLYSASKNVSSTTTELTNYERDKTKAENLMKAADEFIDFKKLPANDADKVALDGVLQPPGSTSYGNIPVTATPGSFQKIDFSTSTPAQQKRFETFARLDAKDQHEILTARDTIDLRKGYKSDLHAAEGGVNRIHADRNSFVTNMNMYTSLGKSVADGLGSMGQGIIAGQKAAVEAEKMYNELGARYAAQDVQLNNETASARESDLNNSIRMLREVTGADIRG